MHSATYHEYLQLVNSDLPKNLNAYPYQCKQVLETAAYSLNAGGHRWRAILFLKIYELLSGQRPPPGVISVSCAIEFVHTATIMLDDLPTFDAAPLRRGKPPAHVKFGEPCTILTACWLCDVAQQIIHDFGKSKAEVDLEGSLRAVKAALITGELNDLHDTNCSEEEILRMNSLKSGTFYSFAAAAPARILELPEAAAQLASFGLSLGISYQISDDIADISGSVPALGKEINKDVTKQTLPRRFGLDRAAQLRRDYFDKAISAITGPGSKFEPLIGLSERIVFG